MEIDGKHSDNVTIDSRLALNAMKVVWKPGIVMIVELVVRKTGINMIVELVGQRTGISIIVELVVRKNGK